MRLMTDDLIVLTVYLVVTCETLSEDSISVSQSGINSSAGMSLLEIGL